MTSLDHSQQISTPERQTSSPFPATAVFGIVGALTVAVCAHRLSKRREALTRKATACTKFRSTVQGAIDAVPHASKHWGNEVLVAMPKLVSGVRAAVAEFAPFLVGQERVDFERHWAALERHCEQTLPKALSPAEVLYGGGRAMPENVKQAFHSRMKALLDYARQT